METFRLSLGAGGRNRTFDSVIKSHVQYHCATPAYKIYDKPRDKKQTLQSRVKTPLG